MNVLEEWVRNVCDELGIAQPVDRDVILDLARDVAHDVARPAAPLTTFLVGLAAGAAGGGPEAVREIADKISALAHTWEGSNKEGTSERES